MSDGMFALVCVVFAGWLIISVAFEQIRRRDVDGTDPRWPSSREAWRRDLERIDADRRAHPERQS